MDKARKATLALQQKRRGYVALWNHFSRISIDSLKEILRNRYFF